MASESASSNPAIVLPPDPLDDVTVGMLVMHGRRIVTVAQTASLAEALRVLMDDDLRSAPVVDHVDRFVGILDRIDILGSLLLLDEHADPEAQQKFLAQPVSEVMGASNRHTLVCVHEATSLKSLLGRMAKGLFRVIVLTTAGHPKGLVSQSGVMAFLLERGLLGPAGATSLEAAHVANNVLTIASTELLSSALLSLFNAPCDVFALAIVDGAGGFVGALADADAKLLQVDFAAHLGRPVLEFIRSERQAVRNVRCDASETVETVARRMVAAHEHQLFVCDSGGRPVGSVTQSDLIQAIIAGYQSL